MGARLFGADGRKRGGVSGPKRPARRGQDNFVDHGGPGARVVWQRLKNRRMLAVNRQQGGASAPYRVHEERPAHHQRLLVGKQEALTCQSSRNARSKTRGAHNRGHHSGHVLMRCDQFQRRRTPQHLCGHACIGQHALELTPMPLADHDGKARPKLQTLLRHQLPLAVGAERKNLVALGVALHHVQRVDPNRARGAQNADALDFRCHGCDSALKSTQQHCQGQHGQQSVNTV